ncbi:TRAP transporter substrate-binding protein DctP [Nocardioides carbamazepini]|uniref:TRAP transporter substrate-binding protein DctP n=1 Tax=Nocardioides carbamazepini TaxID=2854259 RepID=UPI00214A79AF|nr:TRAP transporter substrate-binding protein DctP [Nocardioides carbamazepini]MCR1786284.1 TRAP transporter substrate-binding protein DctP [Nocardioides carbamazepini]
MSTGLTRGRRRGAVLTALTTAMLALAACSGSSATEETNAGGESIEYGADRAAYAEALADMEPVTLAMQSTGPKGSATGRRFEDYAAVVEEWSDGKISFDLTYANGMAPPDEVHLALADGRLDVGSVMPALIPDELPAANALGDLSHLGRQTPVDWMLQWHGIMLDIAAAADDVDREYEAHGMKLLLPAFGSGAYMPYCTDPGASADALDGRGIASQSKVQNREAEALGLAPTSISYAEMFEGLQRGVIDCAFSTVTGAALGGFIPAAPHVAYAEDEGFNSPAGTIAISLARWNELPLAAQQLMFDRLDVLLQANFEGAWENTAAAVQAVLDAGGELAAFDDDAVARLAAVHSTVEEEVAGSDAVSDGRALVDVATQAEEEWANRIDELGIDGVGTSYEDFPAWYARGVPDLQPYFDALWDGAMGERRPS